MAERKVYVEVIVDDKGTTKVVAKDAKELGLNLETLEREGKSAGKKGLRDGVTKNAQSADRAMKGLSKQSSNTTKNFSKMSQGLTGGLVPAYATLAANVFAIGAAFRFLQEAATIESLFRGQEAYAATTGIALKSLTNNIIDATDAQIKFKDASQAAAIGIASGLSPDQLTDLGTSAKNLSFVLGRDVTDSFNRLVRGVTKAEPELLDELGIVLRLKDATEKYGLTLGKSADQLTQFEKSQAIATEVLGQANSKYNDALENQDIYINQLNRLGKAFNDIIITIQRGLSPLIGNIASFLSENVEALSIALTALAVPILKAIVPGFKDMGKNAKIAFGEAKDGAEEAKGILEGLRLKSKQLAGRAGLGAIEARAESLRKTLSGVKFKPNAILTEFQKGSQLTNKQLDMLIKEFRSGKGSAKKLTGDMRRVVLRDLQAMRQGAVVATNQIGSSFNALSARAKLQFKIIGTNWKIMLATMKAATAITMKAINFAVMASAVFGVILMVQQLVKTIVRARNPISAMEKRMVDAANKMVDSFKEVREAIGGTVREAQRLKDLGGEEFYGIKGLEVLGNAVNNISLSTASDFFSTFMEGQDGVILVNEALAKMKGKTGEVAQKIHEVQIQLEHEGQALLRVKNASKLYTAEVRDQERKVNRLKNELTDLQQIQQAMAKEDVGAFFASGFADDSLSEKALGFFKESIGLVDEVGEAQKRVLQEGIGAFSQIGKLIQNTGLQTRASLYWTKLWAQTIDLVKNGIAITQDRVEALTRLLSNMKEVGQLSTSVQQLQKDYNKLTSEYWSSFQTRSKELDLVRENIKLTNELDDLMKEILITENMSTTEAENKLLEYKNQRDELVKQRDVIIDIAQQQELARSRTSALAKVQEIALRRTTNLQRKEIEANIKITRLRLELSDITGQIAIQQTAIREEENRATLESKIRLQALEDQRDVLAEQLKTAMQLTDVWVNVADSAKQAFEDSFSSGLVDLVMGRTNWKEFGKKLALDIMEAMAEVLSDKITTIIMNAFGMDTREQRQAQLVFEAMSRGADEVQVKLSGTGESWKKSILEGNQDLKKIFDEMRGKWGETLEEKITSIQIDTSSLSRANAEYEKLLGEGQTLLDNAVSLSAQTTNHIAEIKNSGDAFKSAANTFNAAVLNFRDELPSNLEYLIGPEIMNALNEADDTVINLKNPETIKEQLALMDHIDSLNNTFKAIPDLERRLSEELTKNQTRIDAIRESGDRSNLAEAARLETINSQIQGVLIHIGGVTASLEEATTQLDRQFQAMVKGSGIEETLQASKAAAQSLAELQPLRGEQNSMFLVGKTGLELADYLDLSGVERKLATSATDLLGRNTAAAAFAEILDARQSAARLADANLQASYEKLLSDADLQGDKWYDFLSRSMEKLFEKIDETIDKTITEIKTPENPEIPKSSPVLEQTEGNRNRGREPARNWIAQSSAREGLSGEHGPKDFHSRVGLDAPVIVNALDEVVAKLDEILKASLQTFSETREGDYSGGRLVSKKSVDDAINYAAEGSFVENPKERNRWMQEFSGLFQALPLALTPLFKGLPKGLDVVFSGFLSQFIQNMFGEGGTGGGFMGKGLWGNLFGGVLGSVLGSGGVVQGGFRSFATGGYATKPTLGLIGEGRYNEAVVPLPDGKSIPVMMGGASQNNVAVNLTFNENGQVEGQSREATNQRMQEFGNAITSVVQKEIANQRRPGGLLYNG